MPKSDDPYKWTPLEALDKLQYYLSDLQKDLEDDRTDRAERHLGSVEAAGHFLTLAIAKQAGLQHEVDILAAIARYSYALREDYRIHGRVRPDHDVRAALVGAAERRVSAHER